MRGRRRVRHGAGGGIGLARQDVREGSVVPVDEVRLRAEVGGQRNALELDPRLRGGAAEAALVPGLEEERDVRLAESVDGLHRVADEEQRAAVARFPPGGQSFQELELRIRGVLELVYQYVADAGVEREQEIG